MKKEGGEAENRGMDHPLAASRGFRARWKKKEEVQWSRAGRANALETLLHSYFPLITLFPLRLLKDDSFREYTSLFVK